ncbi:maltase A1-like [Planococcus citri]|uniref:maltase A1-like n=1 Tax=Planococcus citri TaxID=170843 RepID=UPI0031F99A27
MKMKFVQIAATLSFLISSCWAIDKAWWKHDLTYGIFLKSFMDSNGDGIGDFKGLISKLDYIADLGIKTIWVTPFYPSPQIDGGYDISDFCGINPIYGTMEDFEELMKEMKKRDLNFVMDLVINHSSDEHEWFEKSVNRVEPYTDYYLWADPKGYDSNGTPIPPNNWKSIFDFKTPSSGWVWNEKRKQFYFHQFLAKQPDLNLRNEQLKTELKNMMKFWLDKGVAAFRLDAVGFFMEDPLLREDIDTETLIKVVAAESEMETPRLHHPDTFEFLHELRTFFRQYDLENKRQRETAGFGEVYTAINTKMRYYGTKNAPAMHYPYNYLLTLLKKYLDADQMIQFLNQWIKKLPKGATSNWALGNHDHGRIFYYFNKEYNSILLTIVTMLPGAALIWYGEETSQEQFDFSPNPNKNLMVERDHFRLPMQWDDSLNAGFTSGDKPWVPVHPSYYRSNVKEQLTNKNSTLYYFKDLVSLRKTETLKFGDLKMYAISKWVLAFTRTFRQSKYVIVLNLGTEPHTANLHAEIANLPTSLEVVAASPNSGFSKGEKFNTIVHHRNLSMLRPHSSIVLST